MSARGNPGPAQPIDDSKKELWDLRWVREPQQDRSARTRAQLLDATEKLLQQDGLDGLTIANVAKEAGCSVGSLYHHFQDKQTIIYAVLDRLAKETRLTVEQGLQLERWHDVPLIGILEAYLRYSVKVQRRFPGVLQAQRFLASQDLHIETRLHESNKNIRELVMRLLRPRLSEVNHPDPNLAIAVVLQTLKGALVQREQSYLPRARPVSPRQSDESFVRELLRMASKYLEIDSP